MTPRLPLIATCTLLLAACAHAPSTYPVGSAAAPEATSAPIWSGGRALIEDPPLPGEATTGWEGLAPAASADPHAGHHMHHDHGAMVGPDAGTADAPSPSDTEMEMHHAH